MGRLKAGDKAPDFKLVDQGGKSFHLAGSLKRRQSMHLLYFYPHRYTPQGDH
jgi:peroxiredoxin